MKKLLILGLLGLLFLGGMLHIRLVAQSGRQNSPDAPAAREAAKFPLTFASEEELAEFLETYVPSTLPPSAQTAFDQQKRVTNQNNLKMLALAVHTYHDAWNTLPSSSTTNETGKPMHSWRVALLPFVEGAALYEKIRHDEPWDSEYNKQFHTAMPDCFRSPYLSEEQASKGLTNYVAIVGNLRGGKEAASNVWYSPTQQYPPTVNAIFPGPNTWSNFAHISDGTSNTILFAERREPVCWMDPTGDVPIKVAVQGINTVPNGLGSIDGTGFSIDTGISSDVIEGINVAWADGNVSFVPTMVANPMLEAALTCNGGEDLLWDTARIRYLGGSEKGNADVSGIVTVDGQPISSEVTIYFMQKGRPFAHGCQPDENGRYQLRQLQTGEYSVWFRPPYTMRETIPRMYADPSTTPLAITLQDGQNTVDLALVSGKP